MITCCSLGNVSLNFVVYSFSMQVTEDLELHFQNKRDLYRFLWDHESLLPLFSSFPY